MPHLKAGDLDGHDESLRLRMIEDMTIRNLSPSTQQSYIYAIAKFSRHFGCSPDRLNLEEVRAYRIWINQKRSWSRGITCSVLAGPHALRVSTDVSFRRSQL